MPKIRVQNRYGVAPNQLLNDKTITWKAKGIYTYLQSKPEDWSFAVDRITNDAKDGRDSTGAGIHELEEAGWLYRGKYKNEKGQWDIEYVLYDEPTFNEEAEEVQETIAENPQRGSDETIAENPLPENPLPENPETYKERDTKKDIVKKIYIDDEKINDKILEFIESRKQLKKPMTDMAIKKLVEKSKKWIVTYTFEQISVVFDQSIECGWQGVFEPKNKFQKSSAGKKLACEDENARKDWEF